MGQSVLRRSASAVRSVGMMTVLSRLIGITSTVVIARYLGPDEVGVAAVVVALLTVLTIFVGFGLNAAIVQRRELDQEHLETAFAANMAFAGVIVVGLVAIAPTIAAYFGMAEVDQMLRVFAFVLLFRAASSVQMALCERELNFARIAWITLVAHFTGAGVSIVLAIVGFGAWSILYGQMVTHAMLGLLLWTASAWWPRRLSIDFTRLRDMFSLGAYVALSSFVGTISSKLDLLIVARILSTTAVGLYSMGQTVSAVLPSSLGTIAQTVMFPSFSRMETIEEVRRAYERTVRLMTIIGGPTAIGVAVVAPDIVDIFLGESWSGAVVIVQLLCLHHFLTMMGGSMWAPVLKAQGRGGMLLFMSLLRVCALPFFMLPGSIYGLEGIAASLVVYGFAFRLINQAIVNRYIGWTMSEYLRSIAMPVATALVMAAAVLLSRHLFLPESGRVIGLGLSIAVGATVYLGGVLTFMRRDFDTLVAIATPGRLSGKGAPPAA